MIGFSEKIEENEDFKPQSVLGQKKFSRATMKESLNQTWNCRELKQSIYNTQGSIEPTIKLHRNSS